MPECPHQWHKAGLAWSGSNKVQRYRCQKCGKTTIKNVKEETMNNLLSTNRKQIGLHTVYTYTYNNPDALPVEDATELWDTWRATIDEIEAATIGTSDESSLGRLTEDWEGHKAGELVLSGLQLEGYPFVIFDVKGETK